MTTGLRFATENDRGDLLDLTRRYHEFENIGLDPRSTARALESLLGDSDAGRIWIIEQDGVTVGYIALCFGFSIELGGRDAFIDEFFILEEHRGNGIGTMILDQVQSCAKELGIKALHLEVDRSNERACRLYRSLGFASRERFHLMTRKL